MNTWVSLMLCVAVLTAIAVYFRYRQRELRMPTLDPDQRDQLVDAFLQRLRGGAPGPEQPVGFAPGVWRDWLPDFNTREILELLTYMSDTGKTIYPNYRLDFDGAVWRTLPRMIAMTQNSYQAYTPQVAPVQVYGPAVFGDGPQYNEGFTYTWSGSQDEQLAGLATDLYEAALRANSDLAAKLESVASQLEEAVANGQVRTPRVKAALRWLSGMAADATGSVVGAGIVAAATSLLAALQ